MRRNHARGGWGVGGVGQGIGKGPPTAAGRTDATPAKADAAYGPGPGIPDGARRLTKPLGESPMRLGTSR